MNDDELARLLSDAFDENARAAVPDHAGVSEPHFADRPMRDPRRGRRTVGHALAPILAAAAVVAVVLGVIAVTGDSGSRHTDAAGPTNATAPGKPVHITLANADGATYGVGMPVVAFFSRAITDARSLAAATTVRVNGAPRPAGWYFEPSTGMPGYPLEAHLRPRHYWPAHADVLVSIAGRGLSAGRGLRFANSLSLHFTTGARLIATVDDTTHKMTVRKDGAIVAVYPVSLGASGSPTSSGTKVIMEKGRNISMRGPGYFESNVKFTQQLTYGGEYLHAAPWNIADIDSGVDSSNGCTNMRPDDAMRLYRQTHVGDVVEFPNATGPRMATDEGYGDWNVPWSTWQRGGLVRTS